MSRDAPRFTQQNSERVGSAVLTTLAWLAVIFAAILVAIPTAGWGDVLIAGAVVAYLIRKRKHFESNPKRGGR